MKNYDVLVVGAGPAGSTAARYAARNGLKTLLLEEHQTIGEPVQCGEAVSRRAFNSGEISPRSAFVRAVTEKLVLHFSNKTSTHIKEPGYVLDRAIFDQYLAKLAADKGAEILTSTKAVHFDPKRAELQVKNQSRIYNIGAKVVVGCDGPLSSLGQWAHLIDKSQLKRNLVVGTEYRIKNVEVSDLNFYICPEYTPYYAWVFPRGDNLANAGIINSSEKRLQRFLEEKGISGKIVKKIAGLIPASGPIRQSYCHRLLLAGDAASFTNPVFLGGIHTAIVTGRLAGEVAAEAVIKGRVSADFLRKYQTRWKSLPLADPALPKARKTLYGSSTQKLRYLGSLLNDLDTASIRGKIRLLVRYLGNKRMPLNEFLTLGKAIEITRRWGW